jgi:hypothetical protein
MKALVGERQRGVEQRATRAYAFLYPAEPNKR